MINVGAILLSENRIKARIPSKYGIIEVEGNPEAIKELITSVTVKQSDKSISTLILELIQDGFFDTPHSLGEIREELSRKGFNVRPSSLFPVLHRDILKEGYLEREGRRRSYRYFATSEQRKTASGRLCGKWFV